jgi:hypothetical protein
MQEQDPKKTVDRRAFLKGVGLSAGAAAGAAVIATSGVAEAAVPQEDGKKRVGYRKTEHVRRYYELARF